MYTEKQKIDLLNLARESIKHFMDTEDMLKIPKEEVPKPFLEKLATFVTLTIHGELRGCIGSLSATKELYKDIIDNAVSAAFYDPRFPELSDAEFRKIKIEISVLTPSKKLDYKDAEDLLSKLVPEKHGVVLSKSGKSATFLPQVWEQLSDKKEFLTHLCIKAGLKPDEWKNNPAIMVYEVESFEE